MIGKPKSTKKKVADIVRALENDAQRQPSRKKAASKDKQVHEIQTQDKYKGEASPHWDFVQQRRQRNEDGNITEHVLANPDSLTEEASIYHRPLTEVGELQLEAIRESLPKLSRRQQEVIKLCGLEGYTPEEAALKLGISRLAVRNQLQRASTVIQKCYARKKLLQD